MTESHLGDYYLINTSNTYKPLTPTPTDNLLKKYGLEPVAKSLARTNPDGSKGVNKPIPPGLMDPNLAQHPDIIQPLDAALVAQGLKFDKTPVNGIPGFNSSDLAINDQQTLMRGDDLNDEEYSKKLKRKKKSQNGGSGGLSSGGDLKRQHI
ncbi:Mediator of RNA polymerase II transcription subunit 19 [Candida viswanathii]|uniref:Mediator of RNA polymerase II transcription subunit 19 n=1 Tax=Candida viswanathii TaxID=5486 RepID=A0A367XVX8_9ASCO|nr:Mediator of RNA polymerase II transcription subunit 19 [Candida viswanathii]